MSACGDREDVIKSFTEELARKEVDCSPSEFQKMTWCGKTKKSLEASVCSGKRRENRINRACNMQKA
jgi:hypothetical protein